MKSKAKISIFATLACLAAGLSSGYGQTLLLQYTFDQSSGTTAIDSSASPANGTLTGAGSTWQNTGLPPNFKVDNVYSNSGASGTYVTAGDVAKLDGLGDFTFTGWLNVNSANIGEFTEDRVLSKRSNTVGASFFDLSFTDAGSGNTGLALGIFTGTVGSTKTKSAAMDISSGWFFYAVTRNSTTGAISFFYGTTAGSLTSAGGGTGQTGSIVDNANLFIVGNVQSNTDRAPDADFSEIRIYDSVLSYAAIGDIQASAVPEPDAFGLLLVGVLGVWFAFNRRRGARA